MHSPPQRSRTQKRAAILLIMAMAVVLSCSGVMESLVKEGDRLQYRETLRAAEESTFRAQYRQTFAATFDVLSTQEAAVQGTQTALVADIYAAETAEAAPAAPQVQAPPAAAPPQAETGHVPKILNVDIAREVPANGTKVGGTIIFEDAAQDVVLLRADVLSATLTAESWTYDPRQNMVWSGTRGIAAFQVWCTGDPQDVSYNYTLVDSAGNVSAPWQVNYACK